MTRDAPPARRWPRRAAYGAVLLAGLLAAHTITWFVVTGRIEAGLPEAVAVAAQDGWHIETGTGHRAGWPMRATMRFDGVAATRDFGTTQLRWSAETLDITIDPAAPRTLLVSPGGTQALSAGAAPAVTGRADRLDVRVPLAGGPATAEAQALSLHSPGGTALRIAEVTAQWDGLALAAMAGGIVPSPPMAAPFDGSASLSLRVVVTQPFPATSTPAQSAALWQRAGGRVEVREFALRLASLAVDGSGEGGLDARLQPEGRATLRVAGAAAVLDAAAAAGLVAAGPASAMRAVLGLLTIAAHGGPVALPVELADRTVTVARFPLLRLPVLDWGGP